MLVPLSTCIDRTAPTLVLVDPIWLCLRDWRGSQRERQQLLSCWDLGPCVFSDHSRFSDFFCQNAVQLVTIQVDPRKETAVGGFLRFTTKWIFSRILFLSAVRCTADEKQHAAMLT